MEFERIIMDLEDALYADVEDFKRDAARLDWLFKHNKIPFACDREELDQVIKLNKEIQESN